MLHNTDGFADNYILMQEFTYANSFNLNGIRITDPESLNWDALGVHYPQIYQGTYTKIHKIHELVYIFHPSQPKKLLDTQHTKQDIIVIAKPSIFIFILNFWKCWWKVVYGA